MRLERRKRYLQIAFNRSFEEVEQMVLSLPISENILIEAGTPFIKQYGVEGIKNIKNWHQQNSSRPSYIVADIKCMDRGSNEVENAAYAGASAATCLGLAPTETINEFVRKCEELNIDSMINMLNVKYPFEVLQNLKKAPDVVVLHRGVDESANKEKQIPYTDIHRIKGAYNDILISVAGGENFNSVRSSFFNDADIVVVWREFYDNPNNTKEIANKYLKLIKR